MRLYIKALWFSSFPSPFHPLGGPVSSHFPLAVALLFLSSPLSLSLSLPPSLRLALPPSPSFCLSPAEFRYHTNRTLNQGFYRKGVAIRASQAWLETGSVSGGQKENAGDK